MHRNLQATEKGCGPALSLNFKVMVAMSVVLALMAGAIVVLLRMTFLPSFEQLENEEARRNADRAVESLVGQVTALGSMANDWAKWNVAYAFAGREHSELVDGLSIVSFANAGFNLLAVYDTEGQLLWIRLYDFQAGHELDASDFRPEGSLARHLLVHDKPDGSVEGLVRTRHGPMLVAAKTILTSANEGPSRGTLMMGKLIRDPVINQMKDQVKLPLEVVPVDPGAAGAPPDRGVERLEGEISAFRVMRDLTGAPILMVRTIMPRTISDLGAEAIRFGTASVVLLGVGMMMVLWVLLHCLVLRPIARLANGVLAIGTNQSWQDRVPEDRRDEIGLLARQFNRMMDRLNLVLAAEASARITAERASNAKSIFLAHMSHELRTPLNAIIGFSEVIKEGLAEGPRHREYAADIHRSGCHLLQLVNDLLDLAKAEARRIDLYDTRIVLHPLVAECLHVLDAAATEAGVRIVNRVCPGLPILVADDTRIRQIVMNLTTNAIKFTPQGGRVTVTGRVDDGGGLELCVEDTGIGMTPEQIETALEPFGQVQNALGRRHQGTGLGLPLTKELVELHGGSLGIESEPGKGTRMIVRFPAARTLAAAASPAAGIAGAAATGVGLA